MTKVEITEWEKGFIALDLIHFMRFNGYGLIESKRMVEKLLDGDSIELRFDDAVNLEELLKMNMKCVVSLGVSV